MSDKILSKALVIANGSRVIAFDKLEKGAFKQESRQSSKPIGIK